MDKKIILFAASAGIMLATGAPALAQGDPGEGIPRGVMHGIEAGIDIGIMIVGIMSITTGTIIAIGTTTGIATMATSTSMTTTRAKSEWASRPAYFPVDWRVSFKLRFADKTKSVRLNLAGSNPGAKEFFQLLRI